MALSYSGSMMVQNQAGNNVLVQYIKTTPDLIQIKNIGSTNTVRSTGEYGINSTFFYINDLVGIAIQNGVIVKNYGGTNATYYRGTLYKLNSGSVGVKVVNSASSITGSINDLQWAVGGISLYLDRSYATSTAYFNDINSELNQTNDSIQVTSRLVRTAIGFDGTNIYLLAFLYPSDVTQRGDSSHPIVNLYDMHKILKNDFGLTKAINLDGGTSTGIAFKYGATGNRQVYAVQDNNGVERAVKAMVTVPGSSFGNI